MLQTKHQPSRSAGKLPVEAEMIISAMDTGRHDAVNRRTHRRLPYRVEGRLRLFSDAADAQPWTLYTRDIHCRGVGFISRHRLPLGYGGSIEMMHPDGGPMKVNCTLIRCREIAPGWYEGCLYFSRELPELKQPVDSILGETDQSSRYYRRHASGDLRGSAMGRLRAVGAEPAGLRTGHRNGQPA